MPGGLPTWSRSEDKTPPAVVGFAMNERVKKLSNEIRKLPPNEQAALVDDLLGSLHRRVDPAIEKAWADEAKRRWKSRPGGEVKTIPATQVFSRLGRKRAKAR